MEKSEEKKNLVQHLILHTLLGRISKLLLRIVAEKEKKKLYEMKITFFVTPFPSKQNKKIYIKIIVEKRPSLNILLMRKAAGLYYDRYDRKIGVDDMKRF